jgi:ABC-2 type transport system permease protein
MTTYASLEPAATPSRAVRARSAVAAEWIKLWATRSTYWTLAVAAITGIGLSAVIAFAFAHTPSTGASPPSDPLLPGLLSLEYALLAVGVLGVLTVTAEYSTGLIRTTYVATPHRRTVLAAKAAVAGAITLGLGEGIAFASFPLDQAILSGSGNSLSLGQPGVASAVAATGTLLCVCALLGVGLGTLIRHTAGSIVGLLAVIAVPAATALLPAPWNDRIGRFTLVNAARQATAHHPGPPLPDRGWSLLILLAWPAIILLVAALTVSRQDT